MPLTTQDLELCGFVPNKVIGTNYTAGNLTVFTGGLSPEQWAWVYNDNITTFWKLVRVPTDLESLQTTVRELVGEVDTPCRASNRTAARSGRSHKSIECRGR